MSALNIFTRLAAAAGLLWLAGFLWFALLLPQPAGTEKTEAIVMLTGADGRLQRGVEALEHHWSRRMFISGVYVTVRRAELAKLLNKPRSTIECCVELGKQAVNTRTNAKETAQWLAANKISSLRLVTTDWHMRRARLELEHAIGGNIEIVSDAVPSRPSLLILLREYNKFVTRWLAILLDL